MRVLIAGGGVAGLATALSLERAGCTDVTILEASSLRPGGGVGLNLLPNAVRELVELGLGEELQTRAIPTSALELRHRSGGLVWREPRGVAAGYRWPQYSILRALLVGLLEDAVAARLGPHALRTGCAVTRVEDEPGGVRVLVGDRDRTAQAMHADLLVAADGIHSAVRAQQVPHEGAPCANGLVLWRGVAPVAAFGDGRTMRVVGDDRRRLVVYPVLELADGRRLTNWVMTIPAEEDRAVAPEDRARHAAASFASWETPHVDVGALITATPDVLAHPMIDREPLDRWVSGRTVLVGDAAHPMFPAGSTGATQAIVDARVLVRELSRRPIDEALASYEAERRPAMTALQRANRRLGPELAITLAHERAPDGFADIHDVIDPDELQAIASDYADLGGFAPEALHARPSNDPQRSLL